MFEEDAAEASPRVSTNRRPPDKTWPDLNWR